MGWQACIEQLLGDIYTAATVSASLEVKKSAFRQCGYELRIGCDSVWGEQIRHYNQQAASLILVNLQKKKKTKIGPLFKIQ